MCYTLNNGSCLRSGQAVASRAPARQGGCAAGFFHSLRKRKTWVEERPCERDGLTAKRNKARHALMLPVWPPRKPEPSCSSARHRLWQTGAQPGQAHGLPLLQWVQGKHGPRAEHCAVRALPAPCWGDMTEWSRAAQASWPPWHGAACVCPPAEPGHGPSNPLGRTHLHWRSGTATNPLPWQTALAAVTLAGYI